MRRITLLSVFLLFTVNVFAQERNIERKIYYTKKINPEPPMIDGILDDEVWRGLEWGGDFIQQSPYDGKEPSQETSFKITYDDNYLYVAFRLYDTEPDKIESRVTRRDRFPGDWVEINIDSYYDHRTAFSFTLSCSGVRSDELVSEDGENWDPSWDPIWYAKTHINGDGWTGEMRIPLNQLRFADKEEQVWGLQFTRRLYRKEERSIWQHKPADAPGWVSQFGELRGIRGIKSKNSIELLPYSVAKLETSLKEAGNPFSDGKNPGMRGGLDAKFGVTSDLTLNLTVNPDFGQVEADPSVVNLSAYETFYQERRPFFVEGKNILNYQLTGGDGDFSSDNLFYSRRIGSSPHHYPDTDGSSFLDMPSVTNIAAAAKLTGKTRDGYSIGLMNAVTTNESAEIDAGGLRSKEAVEPMTNYFVGRLQKDFRKGDTRLGGIVTSTYRDINDAHLDFLNKEAYTGGFDFVHNWKEKTYYFIYNTVFSHIKGKNEAILRAQEAPARYFQRPDADYLDLDPDATSMTGHGGRFSIGKGGNGHWRYDTGITWRSPGLELNDVGYLRQADVAMQHFWMQFMEWNPKWIFRNFSMNFNQWSGWNFGGDKIFSGGNVNLNMMFKNYWTFGMGFNRNSESYSQGMLRGGPSFRTPGRWNMWYNIDSDQRKSIYYGLNGFFSKSDESNTNAFNLNPRFSWRIKDSLILSTFPFYSRNHTDYQYMSTVNVSDGSRYLLGRIDQTTMGFTMRVDYSITPNLSIQYYGQPFVSAGKYTDFKKVTSSRADKYENRIHEFSTAEISYDSENKIYSINELISGSSSYSFGNPNFNFRQFRSNLVIRWEYIPGSTMFIVWSQERTKGGSLGDFSFRDDMDDLFNVHPNNVFLIKINRWFAR
ncbi:DUF5916 domain-containing protein [candidate division KSB1 bacterium]